MSNEACSTGTAFARREAFAGPEAAVAAPEPSVAGPEAFAGPEAAAAAPEPPVAGPAAEPEL